MRSWGKGWVIAISMAAATAGLVSLSITQSPAQAPATGQAVPGLARICRQADFSGVWEANNTANWDLQTHVARSAGWPSPGLTPNSVVLAAPVVALRHPRLGSPVKASWKARRSLICRGRRRERRRTRNTGSTATAEIKCFQPGGAACRCTCRTHFQIIESAKDVMMLFRIRERSAHDPSGPRWIPYPNVAYMGYSTGHWEGDTLVTDLTDFTRRDMVRQGREFP